MTFFERELDHISLFVPNLEKATDFYTNTLGFKIKDRFKSDNNEEFIFITDGHVTYELIEKPGYENTVIDHVAYVSEDIKADYDHFNELGLITIELSAADFLFENGMAYFFIKGAGNDRIEFCQKI